MIGKKASGIVDLVSLLILATMVFWFGYEMVWGGKVPFFRDLGPYFYPMRFSLANSFQSGELPLWDRHVGMGSPLLANFQSGTFYPPHLIFFFLPFFGAIGALYVFHYLVAATGAYCLCRRWSYSPSLAIIGAVLFTFGGYTVSLTNLLNHFQTAVWLPWVLLLGERSLRSKSWRDPLLFTLVLLVQFLAGSPEVYVLSLGLFLLDGWRVKRTEGNITYLKLLALFLTTNSLVLGLAMVQILPTLELLLQSLRFEALPYAVVTSWSFHPLGLINLFFLDKAVDLSLLTGLRLFFNPKIPWTISTYIGAIALPGILFWLFNSSMRERVIILGLIVSTIILAMGRYTPVFPLLYEYLPLINLFRFPEKFLFLTNALLLYVVLRGLFFIFQSDGSSAKGWSIALLAPLTIWLFLYLYSRIERESLVQLVNQVEITAQRMTHVLERRAVILVYLERQVALYLGLSLILFLWKRGQLRTGLCQTLLVGLVFFDLASAHRPYQFLLEPEFVYGNNRVVSSIDPEPSRLFYITSLSYLHPTTYFLNKRPFAEKVSAVHESLVPNTGIYHGFDYLQEIDAMVRSPYDLFITTGNKLPPERLYRLLGVMNVKYLNSAEDLPSGGITLERHFPEYPSWLYRLNRTVPRTYIVPKAIGEKDPVKILDRLSSVDFDPLKQVILERPLPIVADENFHSQAKIVRYKNHHVTIQASLSNPGVLVLADSFYPGWKVFVDGEEREVLRANYFFRGVFLPPGDHQVVFRYEPASFYYGAVISLLTLFLLPLILAKLGGRKVGKASIR